MGALDSIRSGYGDLFDQGGRHRPSRSNWGILCSCGHLAKYHAPSIGGDYRTHDGEQVIRGEAVKLVTAFDGCVGAMPHRGAETETRSMDRTVMVMTTTVHPTCPCTEMRPIAKVDRPNRYFNQRLNDRHPFLVGVQAFTTHLSRRKAALDDPDWPAAEFDRRFIWIPEAQRCSISGCKATGDDVLPAYVNGDRDSAMRCSKHR